MNAVLRWADRMPPQIAARARAIGDAARATAGAATARAARVSPHALALSASGAVLFALLGVHLLGDPRAAQGFTRAPIVVRYAGLASRHAGAADGHHHGAEDRAHADSETAQPVAARPENQPHDHSHDAAADPISRRAAPAAAEAAEAASGPALAPPPGLTQPGPGGALPAIAPDGRQAADVYARPFPADDARPRIAVMATGLGLAPTMTADAITALPPEVALAFSPYAADLQAWVDRARAAGHEVLLALPMEPFEFPANDPGPHVLLTTSTAAELVRRLDWLMARATGYVGVTNHLGARFTADGDAVGRMLRVLSGRGVAFIHADAAERRRLPELAAATGARFAAADVVLDPRSAGRGLDDQLLRLEARALQDGDALGAFEARPHTIDALARWAEDLEAKGYALAPVSALARARTRARDLLGAATAGAADRPPAPRFRLVKAGFGGQNAEDYADGEKSQGGGGKDHDGGH